MEVGLKTDFEKCDDIYTRKISQTLSSIKRMRQIWLRNPNSWNADLFQYAEPESNFYLHRFFVDRVEKATGYMVTEILIRVMSRYNISFELPEHHIDAPFAFIICENKNRIGFRFEDFYYDEDVNATLKEYEVNEVILLRLWKRDITVNRIERENKQYQEDHINMKSITLEDFFDNYFGSQEFKSFLAHMNQYVLDVREELGFKTISFLSPMNLATHKHSEDLLLSSWPYQNYRYQIINKKNTSIKKYLYLSDYSFPQHIIDKMAEAYLSESLYRAAIGKAEFAESFITSEWLYSSLNEKQNFDYTSVISGYLKSIEQLLSSIVMLNVDTGCKITLSAKREIVDDIKKSGIATYRFINGEMKTVPCSQSGYYFIDLTSSHLNYIDSSMGTFEKFLRNNPHIFIDQSISKVISDMVCCFRVECRNGFFHTHNLNDWRIVEKTRANTIFLFFVLLGGCIATRNKKAELGIISYDTFDIICKRINEFRNYNPAFIFEYESGMKINVVYDVFNNTIEYTENGVEHFQRLLFYQVSDFSMESFSKLDRNTEGTQKILLTRKNVPKKIYGVYRNGSLKELTHLGD